MPVIPVVFHLLISRSHLFFKFFKVIRNYVVSVSVQHPLQILVGGMRFRITSDFKAVKNNPCLRNMTESTVNGLLAFFRLVLFDLTLYVDSNFCRFCLLDQYNCDSFFIFLLNQSITFTYCTFLFPKGKTILKRRLFSLLNMCHSPVLTSYTV